MLRRCAVASLAGAACLLPIMTTVRADDAPAVIVLDGSGSMWGDLGASKVPKIEAVRSSVAAILAGNVPAARIGLYAFGHRRRGDCSDVEAVAPIGDAKDALTKLATVEPKGKGPLALAVQQAAEALPAARAGTVIVLHDGADNCQREICAAVRDATAARPSAKFRFIGLSLPRPEALKHACLAELDNVTIVPADDPATLTAALQAALPSGTVAAKAEQQPRETLIKIDAALAAGGAALNVPLRWRIFKAGDTNPVAQSTSVAFSGALPPGDYEAEAAVDLVVRRSAISVDPDGKARATIPLDAGAAALKGETGTSNARRPELMSLYTRETGSGALLPWRPLLAEVDLRRAFYLPAGDYRLRLTVQGTHADVPFTITPGATTDVALPPPPGEVSVTVTPPAADSAAAEAAPLSIITVTADSPGDESGSREVLRATALEATFVLPPGRYEVAARRGEAEARQTIVLEPGNRQSITLTPPIATVEFTSVISFPGPDVSALAPTIDVFTLEPQGRETPKRLYASAGKINLAPGRYLLSAKLGAGNVRSASEITVAPGTLTRTTFNLQAGEARLSLNGAAQSTAGTPVWRISSDDGRDVWRGVTRRPSVLLAPGRYRVVAELRSARFSTDFEVKNGETTAVDVTAR